MKRTIFCLLAGLALSPAPVCAAPAFVEITAPGTGAVTLPPDLATVNASIATNAADAEAAIAQNNAIYERVIAGLLKLGISRGDISLTYYRVNYTPRPRDESTRSPQETYGYTVARSFAVKTHAIGQAGTISDACIAAGATDIEGVSFGLADPTAAQSAATARAVSAARAGAQAVAAAAGLRIVAVKSIELSTDGSFPRPLIMARVAAANGPPTEFDASNVNVTVSITAVFLAAP